MKTLTFEHFLAETREPFAPQNAGEDPEPVFATTVLGLGSFRLPRMPWRKR